MDNLSSYVQNYCSQSKAFNPLFLTHIYGGARSSSADVNEPVPSIN
jgi:hypothetical protein